MLAHLAGREPGIITARNPAPGQVELSATYGHDTITMLRSGKGIEMTIGCTINGNLSKETYRADSESNLRQNFPAAHQLHESLLASAGYARTAAGGANSPPNPSRLQLNRPLLKTHSQGEANAYTLASWPRLNLKKSSSPTPAASIPPSSSPGSKTATPASNSSPSPPN